VFSILVAIAFPLTYFYRYYLDLTQHVNTLAQVKAAAIDSLVSRAPELWRYNIVAMDELLLKGPFLLTDERATVRDNAGNSLFTVGELPRAPVLTLSAPVYDFGQMVGSVEVAHSYRALTFNTLIVALIGALLGAIAYIVFVMETRELKKASAALAREQAALRVSEDHYRTLFDSASDGIMTVTASGRIVAANKAFARIHGYTVDEILTINLNDLDAPQTQPLINERMQRILSGEAMTFEVEHYHKDGHIILLEVTTSLISSNGEPLIQALHRDITERKQLEKQVRQLAFLDELTKLPNRRLLNNRLSQAMAYSKRSGNYGALMMLDLDNFKQLNDALGHHAGDLLLLEVARRLIECVRETDTVARVGGDEFVVMLSELSNDRIESARQAGEVAEKIRVSLAAPYQLTLNEEGPAGMEVQHHCSASIGVVLFLNHEASQSDLLKWADAAMYQAKVAGRNSVQFSGASKCQDKSSGESKLNRNGHPEGYVVEA
jgi:diguanylate cyclase (GGDEF)-like protein/PAS domain S-box-containing protein